MEENIKVKVLRSLGTAQGVLNPGAVLSLDERTANDWEMNGLVEVIERPEPPKQPKGDDQEGDDKQPEQPEGDDQEDEGVDKQPDELEGAPENKESNEALQTAVETPEAKKPAARNSKAKK